MRNIICKPVITKSLFVSLTFLLFLLIFPSSCQAATYYVAKNGNDSNPGTLSQPYKTVNKGIQSASAGDNVILRAGTYTDNEIAITRSGSASSWITLKAYETSGSKEEVIWKNASGGALHFKNSSYWNVDGIIFDGLAGIAIEIGEFGTNQSLTNYVHHVAIRNSQFSNSTGMGIRLVYADDITIEGNKFINLRSKQAGADLNAVSAAKYGHRVYIRNNIFEDIGSDGVHLGAWDGDIGDVSIENNQFYISGSRSPVGENGIDIKEVHGPIAISGNIFHGFKPTVSGQDASGSNGEGVIIHEQSPGGPSAINVTIEKNLFYNNSKHLVITNGPKDIKVTNNIFRDSAATGEGNGLEVWNANNVQILHNTFYNNKNNLLSYRGTNSRGQIVTSGTLMNNIFWKGGIYVSSSTPDQYWTWDIGNNAWSGLTMAIPAVFRGNNDLIGVDLKLNADFTPQTGSPLINVGTVVGVTTDYIGNLRDNQPDIGAYEYTSGIRPTPPPTSTPGLSPTSIIPIYTPKPTQTGCARKADGDANCDGKVDGVDYSYWLNSQCTPNVSLNQSCGSYAADFNNDGNVDDTDYQIWFGNRG